LAGEQRVKLTDGTYTVYVWCTKLDHNLDKPLFDFQMPRSKVDMEAETAPSTWLVDIGRIKELITIQGFLPDEPTTSAPGGTASSAYDKKADLFAMMKKSRAITLSWGTTQAQTATGNLLKCMVKESPGQIGTSPPTAGESTEKGFAVQIAMIVGDDK